MTKPGNEHRNAQESADQERIRQAVTKLVEGTGFVVQELAHGLVISNPQDEGNGYVHITFDGGYVFWERVVWDFWGSVVEGPRGAESKVVTREMVVGVLGG